MLWCVRLRRYSIFKRAADTPAPRQSTGWHHNSPPHVIPRKSLRSLSHVLYGWETVLVGFISLSISGDCVEAPRADHPYGLQSAGLRCSKESPTYSALETASARARNPNLRCISFAPYRRPTPPPLWPVNASCTSSLTPAPLRASLKVCLKEWKTRSLFSMPIDRMYRWNHFDHASPKPPCGPGSSRGNS